jgi:hypothetical protein
MPEKTENDWVNIANDFYQRTQFPNCIGAVDGKHVQIKMLTGSGSLFYDCKHFFSILRLALVAANYCFIAVDVGAVGKSSDSNVFKKSNIGRKMESNQLGIPGSRPLPNDENGKCIPFVVVGDEAFALSEHVLCPYPNRNLSVQQRMYNYILTRAHRMVECSFGILANKWRIFQRPLDVTPQFSSFSGLGVSVLAFGTQVRGFKPGLSRRIFQGEKFLSVPSFGREVKPWVPCHRFTACKRSLGASWKLASRQN